MAAPAVYKQNLVTFSVGGIPIMDIAEDESISVTYDRQRIEKTLDINTGGLFSVRNGKPAAIEVPILQHSKWITILSNYKDLDMMIPICLSDNNAYGNGMKFISAHAMIQDPDFEYGSVAASRVFRFEVIHLSDVVLPGIL